MSDANKPTSGAPEDEWISIGGSAPKAGPVGPLVDGPEAVQDEQIYGQRKSTPPGLISVRVGGLALALMLLLYIFADLRDVDIPGERPLRFGFVLMLIPALGILWGVIGLVKREKDDVRRSMVGIVLSLASFGIAYATVANTRANAPAEQPAADRTNLPPQDLNKWREEKLHRNPDTN